MSRKKKGPPDPPSKAYLLSFGDTMTALLAFFIVLNSLAKEQTGAKMYAGTGSFVNAVKSLGVPGSYSGDRSSQITQKSAPVPVYAIPSNDPNRKKGEGPDEEQDPGRVIDRQADDFHRFLNEMQRKYAIDQAPPIQEQVVLDCWTKLQSGDDPLNPNALQMAVEAVAQLESSDTEIEVVFWATMPSPVALKRASDFAAKAEGQFDRLFRVDKSQRRRIRFAAKPWLFSDAKRPIVSFVVSRISQP